MERLTGFDWCLIILCLGYVIKEIIAMWPTDATIEAQLREELEEMREDIDEIKDELEEIKDKK